LFADTDGDKDGDKDDEKPKMTKSLFLDTIGIKFKDGWDKISDYLEDNQENIKIPHQTIPSYTDEEFHEHCQSLEETTNFKVIRNKIFKVYTELKETDLDEIKQFVEIAPFITQCRLKSIEQKFNDSNIITDNLRSLRKHAFSYMFNHLIGKELHEGNKFNTTLYDHLKSDHLSEEIKAEGQGSRMSFIYNIYRFMIKRTVNNYNEFTGKRIGDNQPFLPYDDEEEEEGPPGPKDPKDPKGSKKKDEKGKVKKMTDTEIDTEIEYLTGLFHQFDDYLYARKSGGEAELGDDDEYTYLFEKIKIRDVNKLRTKLGDLIAEQRSRNPSGAMPVPDGADGAGMAGARGGSKSSGSAPSFGNTDQYSRDKSRQIARDKIKQINSRPGTTMRVNNHQRGVGNNNTKINSYRTHTANNRYNSGNTTRLNQRLNQRRK
jgi:hypothetical protein